MRLSTLANASRHLDSDACIAAWGSPDGAPPLGYAFTEGIEVNGRFTADNPILLQSKSIVGGFTRFPAIALATPGHNRMVYGNPNPRTTFQNLTLAVNNNALHGVQLRNCNGSTIRDIQVSRALDTGFTFRNCQSMLSADSFRAYACGGKGIFINGCNNSRFSNLRVQNCGGIGIHILGDYDGPGPWPLNGDMEINSLSVEGCPEGVVVENHVKGVVLSSIYTEIITGRALTVRRAPVVLNGGSLRSTGDVINLSDAAYLKITAPLYVDSPTTEPIIRVGQGCHIEGLDYAYCWSGKAMRVIRVR